MPSQRKPTTRHSGDRTFGENVRQARGALGVSVEQLSIVTGIETARLRALEGGTAEPLATLQERVQLGMWLGRSRSELESEAPLAEIPEAGRMRLVAAIEELAPPPPPPPEARRPGPKSEALTREQRRRFATNVKARRKAFGWTGADMKARVGIWPATLSRWEDPDDTRAIAIESLDSLAEAFGCTVEDLLDRDPPPTQELPRVPPSRVRYQPGASDVFFSFSEPIDPARIPEFEAEARALVERFTSQASKATTKYPTPPAKPGAGMPTPGPRRSRR